MSFLYLNPGYGNLFERVSQDGYIQITNSDSITGKAFHSCGTRVITFPTGLSEIWLRYDFYPVSTTVDAGFSVNSNSKNVQMFTSFDYNSMRPQRVYLNSSEKGNFGLSSKWNHYLVHIKSGVSDGVCEIWENEDLKFSFTGNVLNGEQMLNCDILSTGNKQFSQIIISDTEIKWTENVIVVPTTISGTMTDNGDGTYSATEAGQYVNQTIDNASLRESFPDNTVITGFCIAGRPAYYDGNGIDTMQATDNNNVIGECQLTSSSAKSIYFGERVNKPISNISGTYGWKAK